jgi:hypothetical protein
MPPKVEKKEKGLPATVKAKPSNKTVVSDTDYFSNREVQDTDEELPPTQKAKSVKPEKKNKSEKSKRELLMDEFENMRAYTGIKKRQHYKIFRQETLDKIKFDELTDDDLQAILDYYNKIVSTSKDNRNAMIEPFDKSNKMEVKNIIREIDKRTLAGTEQEQQQFRIIDQRKTYKAGEEPQKLESFKKPIKNPHTKYVEEALNQATKGEGQITKTKKEEAEQTTKQQAEVKDILTPPSVEFKTPKEAALFDLKKYEQVKGMEELEKLHNEMLKSYKKPKLFVEKYEETKKRIEAIPAKVAAPELSNKDNGSILQAPSQATNKKVDIKDYANKDYIENQDYNKVSKMTQDEFNKYMEQKAYTEYAEQQNKKVEQQAKSNKPKDESLTSQMGQTVFRQDQGMSVGLNQMFSNQQIDEQKNEQEQKNPTFASKGGVSGETVIGTANDLANPVSEAVRQALLLQIEPKKEGEINVNRRIPVVSANSVASPKFQEARARAYAQAQAPNQVANQRPIANPARQRPKYKAYSPEELTALYAEREREALNAKAEADAGAQQDKTIGDRAKTGLGTYEMKPAADVVLKSNADKKKSIHNFANFSWIESRSDSKLGEFSSLKKMIDGEERMRFSHTYRSTNTLPKSQPVLYNKNHAFFKNYLENRMTPMSIANIQQERQPMTQESNQRDGRRPVGARPWTLSDLGDYTYNFNGVVGTQNLGMTPMYQNERKTDYENNTTVFPDTIVDVPDDKLESV